MSTLTPAIATSFQMQSRPNTVVNFASSHAKTLGIVQITMGFLSIMFCFLAIVYQAGMYIVADGIWGGTLYIIAGGLTLGAAKNKNKCMIIASLILSIIASVAATVQVSVSLMGFILGCFTLRRYDHVHEAMRVRFIGHVAISLLLALSGLVAMTVGIIISALSCKVICCRSMQTDAPVQGIILEDVVMPGSTSPSVSMLPPPAYEPIATNPKKDLI
ncbi:hypothetical protein CAPTEDRAFT_219979 [Capitella teleta]|uniref:Uncharacterized protein n=1 Tax=Capitella teleta TaxID=283909 RepID=R7TBA3_CAPTE|nr:hypothetical protein CAPTEDRAFT_219979 [Capitella teleta]|eukprot:ELT88747.1 hypothetical protein CAPTEDRAFT_219979 [Capitella teleta]